MFIEQRQVGQMAVFAYLIGDEKSGDALVIDPAADTDAILRRPKAGRFGSTILSTPMAMSITPRQRGHQSKDGAKIIIHEEDADMLVSTPTAMLRMFCAKQSPPADQTVRDGDCIALGGSAFASFTPPVILRAASCCTPTVTPSPAIRCL